MVTNRTITTTITTAMFTIAIALSLVAVSSLIGSAHAIAVVAKKQTEYGIAPQASLTKEKPISTQPQNTNAHKTQILTLGNPDAISEKQIKSLSKCEKTAATNGDLRINEVKNCYDQVFNREGDSQATDQPSSSRSNNLSMGAHGQEPQKSSPSNGPNAGTMREGFPF
ncbi:MAG TPA: hypothetical protein VJ729_00210 [Nitrososphaeraceae archaeon]|nr:hypothetical protein [Nitrososphaeraceae archaeon]